MGSLPTPAAALLSLFYLGPALVGCAISVIIGDYLRCGFAEFKLVAHFL
jgi:hypothetical protein